MKRFFDDVFIYNMRFHFSGLLLSVVFFQLEDDPGAPPDQAWRRKINSHADILKEFRVTFMEGLKMVVS